MNLEEKICAEIAKQVNSEEVEDYIKKAVRKMLENRVDVLFSYGGSLQKKVDEELKATMAKSVERMDFGEYLPKIDSVLTQVVNESRVGLYKRMANNLKKLLGDEEIPETISVSEIFKKYKEYCSVWVNTDELEVYCGDETTYYDITCQYEVENTSSSKGIKDLVIKFSCDEDEELNKQMRLKECLFEKYLELPISYHDIKNLRYLDGFEIFILQLAQKRTKIIVDKDYDYDDCVEVYERPECNYE